MNKEHILWFILKKVFWINHSSDSKINKIKLKIGWSGYSKPPIDANEALLPIKKYVLQKWLGSVSSGLASNHNDIFSHYQFSFPEVLTRDWVQITQKIENTSNFHYNSSLFPISRKFGFRTFLDLNKLIDIVYNEQTKKTYRNIINPFTKYSGEKRNFAYTREFIKTMYDNLLKSPNKKEEDLAKSFVPRIEIIDIEKYNKSLSFLNIKSTQILEDIFSKTLTKTGTKESYASSFETITDESSWIEIEIIKDGYFTDRWLRSSLAPDQANEGTKNSWVLYNNKGKPVPYKGNFKKIDGTPVTTRPEAYWTFLLKSHGVGIRNISSIWLSPKRDAVTMWGYIPKTYQSEIKYLQFKNVNSSNVIKIPIRFNVDNLFYYSEKPGAGKKTTLNDEGFVSWNIDYTTMGTWVDSKLQDGSYEMNFIDKNGKIVNIMWNNKKITMTGNGKSVSSNGTKKSTDHIITLNWQDKIYTPIVIRQNDQGKDIISIRNQFPI